MALKTITFSDKTILALPYAASGQYMVRDAELAGFYLVVGKRKKTFVAQAEYWSNGERHGKRLALGAAGELSAREARIKAKETLAKIARGDVYREEIAAQAAAVAVEAPTASTEVTLRQAWLRYRTAHMERKGRSPATIAGYADHVQRLLADWLDEPLRALGENPAMVAERHDRMSTENGPCAANGSMRTLRAIYNHARKSHRELPPENPTLAVDWNTEKRRDTAMGADDLPGWFRQAKLMRHPVRREFHLFTLLSGSRPGALLQARLEHLKLRERTLHIPRPKGGANRAFDIPLSRPMIRCLIRAIRASRMLFPEQAAEWIFAGDSVDGHMVEHKESRTVLAKWGNDLRQTYRTMGQVAGLSEIDMHLLMNHSLPGVNAGYITRAKLISGHLRAAQEKLSKSMMDNSHTSASVWPFLASRKIGDALLDPTPPDPRCKVFREAPLAVGNPPSTSPAAALAEPQASTDKTKDTPISFAPRRPRHQPWIESAGTSNPSWREYRSSRY